VNIGYVDDCDEDYTAELTKVSSIAELRAFGEKWRYLAADAVSQIEAMTEADFPAFKKALKSERRGKFCGEAAMIRFGAILLPEIMMHVGLVAQRFGAPFGCAFIRMKDAGAIVEQDGIAVMAPRAQS
jgi:hypothetical protein